MSPHFPVIRLVTVDSPCRDRVPTFGLLQNISGLYPAYRTSHASVSHRSLLHRADIQRERHDQLPRPHKEFWRYSQAH